ncbi:hypothetical protein HHI36_000053 [Cryptolaemus montrouzieri]|uniref:CRAL-TRIO domain-containing protein n=1 Tax=Cryptolaemus montrouzieri TaxID=559131 RepID=A0ABD2P470_9CUCU
MMKPTDLSVFRDEIFAKHQKSDIDLQNDLTILKEWMKKQPHLPMDKLEDGFLEVQLLKNKFSIEKTKSKIENYCTVKANKNYRYFYEDYPTSPSKETAYYVPIPKLTDNYERILLGKIDDPEQWDVERECSNVLILREFLMRFDYNEGEIFIMDYSTCSTAKILSMLRANILADTFNVIFIFVYEDVEKFKEKFPSRYLPKEYGGELESLDEIKADLDKLYSENRDELNEYVNTKSREDLRLENSKEQEMQGTFRNLKID